MQGENRWEGVDGVERMDRSREHAGLPALLGRERENGCSRGLAGLAWERERMDAHAGLPALLGREREWMLTWACRPYLGERENGCSRGLAGLTWERER
jgi:hypothetical protein